MGKPPPYEVIVLGAQGDVVTLLRAELDSEEEEQDPGNDAASLAEDSIPEEEEDGEEEEGGPLSQLDMLILRSSQLLESSESILATTLSSRAEFSRLFSLEDALAGSFRHEMATREALSTRDDLEMAAEELGRSVDDFLDGPRSRKVTARGRMEDERTDPRTFLRPETTRCHPPRTRTIYVAAEIKPLGPEIPEQVRPLVDSPPSAAVTIPERSSSLIGTWKSPSEVLAGIIPGLSTPSTPPSAVNLLSAIAASSPPRPRHTPSASVYIPPFISTTPPTSRRHSLASLPTLPSLFGHASPNLEGVATIFEDTDLPPIPGPSTPSLYHPPIPPRTPSSPSPLPGRRPPRSRAPPPTLSRFLPNPHATPLPLRTPSPVPPLDINSTAIGTDEFPLIPTRTIPPSSPSPSTFVPPLSNRSSLSLAAEDPWRVSVMVGDLEHSSHRRQSLVELKERLEAMQKAGGGGGGGGASAEGETKGRWWNAWS